MSFTCKRCSFRVTDDRMERNPSIRVVNAKMQLQSAVASQAAPGLGWVRAERSFEVVTRITAPMITIMPITI